MLVGRYLYTNEVGIEKQQQEMDDKLKYHFIDNIVELRISKQSRCHSYHIYMLCTSQYIHIFYV